MSFLATITGFLSKYANEKEKRIDKFLRGISTNTTEFFVKRNLIDIIDDDLIETNIWIEKKYKGYKYLTKSNRKRMYKNAAIIKSEVLKFARANPIGFDFLKDKLAEKKLTLNTHNVEKLKFLYQIMMYLHPNNHFQYIKTASFGKLLENPLTHKLKGDCNQIVTLYAALYSLKFEIEDLKIKLLPEHVCLHFNGIDIEATNATFQKYKQTTVLPITEIISTNMLDISDFREKTQKISARTFIESAKLAYKISSLKELVTKNLKVGYDNIGINSLNQNDFKTALYYFHKSGNKELEEKTNKNAALYYSSKKNFHKALYYATKTHNPQLSAQVKHNEGIYYYQKNNLSKAMQIFVAQNNEKMKQAIYGKRYNRLIKSLKTVKTINDAKKHKHTYKKLLELAYKMKDEKLIQHNKNILGQI